MQAQTSMAFRNIVGLFFLIFFNISNLSAQEKKYFEEEHYVFFNNNTFSIIEQDNQFFIRKCIDANRCFKYVMTVIDVLDTKKNGDTIKMKITSKRYLNGENEPLENPVTRNTFFMLLKKGDKIYMANWPKYFPKDSLMHKEYEIFNPVEEIIFEIFPEKKIIRLKNIYEMPARTAERILKEADLWVERNHYSRDDAQFSNMINRKVMEAGYRPFLAYSTLRYITRPPTPLNEVPN